MISLVAAAPSDEYSPPVLLPNQTSIWLIGSNQTVTWCVARGGCESRLSFITSFLLIYDPVHIYRNVTNPPKQITNREGKIILVKNGILLNFG